MNQKNVNIEIEIIDNSNIEMVLSRELGCVIFFFKQKTAYEIVSRDWSSDVCSSDLFLKLFLIGLARSSLIAFVCVWRCYPSTTDAHVTSRKDSNAKCMQKRSNLI